MFGGNMCQAFLRRVILSRIEERGRAEGAPIVSFPEREISVAGEDVYVGQGWIEWLLMISGFYLALPPNTYGVVVYPDGTARNLQGGMYEVPAGAYRINYIDRHERTDVSEPVSEITTDGEKLTLKIIVRYRVNDPVLALGIDRPIETMMEHLETDVAQYIRTHDHSEIADSADRRDSRLFTFFSERHNRRTPLSQAIHILGVELKEFSGDREFVEMRRKVRADERQTQLIRQQEEHQQEINRLKAQFKSENDRVTAALSADLNRQAAQQRAEIETIEAKYKREKEEILRQVYLQEIEMENNRKRQDQQFDKIAKAFDAVSQAVSGGYLVNPNALNTVLELVQTLKEEIRSGEISPPASPAEKNTPETGTPHVASPSSPPPGNDKVEKLTNTLLSLLKPKK
jgi:hypothetical protein